LKKKSDKWWIKKKPTRKTLVRAADSYFSKYIRLRDKRCVVCGTTENLTCGHLFSRVSYSLRWSEKQCFAQCASCNLRHEHDPYPFTRWFISRYGLDQYDQLHAEWKKTKKFSGFELAEIAEYYKDLIKKIETV